MSSGAVGPTNRRPRHINSERVAQRVVAHRIQIIGLLPLARQTHVQKRAASCIFAAKVINPASIIPTSGLMIFSKAKHNHISQLTSESGRDA
jgi:hypothetical protein